MSKPLQPVTKVSTALTITPENKCSFCIASKCCTYVTQAIDTPRKKYDFEHLLWQVSHRNVMIYKDSDGWYLMFDTPCEHLSPEGRCSIYTHRPQICRDHSNDYCEFDASAEDGFDELFKDYESLLNYCKKRYKRWKWD